MFKARVIFTVTGYVNIAAKSVQEAKEQVKYLNDVGVNYSCILDPEYYSEIELDEDDLVEEENE